MTWRSHDATGGVVGNTMLGTVASRAANPNFSLPRVFWGIACILFAVVATVTFVLGVIQEDTGLFLCALACIPSLLICIAQYITSDRDIASPLNFFLLTVFLGTTVNTFYIVLVHSDFVIHHILLDKPLAVIEPGLWAILIGVFSLIIGYLSAGSKRASIQNISILKNSQWNDLWVRVWITALILVATVCAVLYLKDVGVWKALQTSLYTQFSTKHQELTLSGSEAPALGYLQWGVQLYQIAFLILLARYLESRISLFSLRSAGLLVLGLLSILIPFLTSSRSQLIYVVLYALIVIHYSTRGLRLRAVILMAAICVVIVGGMGVIRYVQQHNLTQSGYSEYENIEDLYESSIGNRHFLAPAKTSHIIDGVPEKLNYQLGETLVLWIIAPIPRSLWPGKPVVRIGGVLGPALFGDPITSGTPPGFVGELYYDFGWLGIPLGMFILGAWLRLLHNSFADLAIKSKNARLVFIYFLLAFAYTLPSEDFTGAMTRLLLGVIPMAFILWCMGSRASADNL